MVGRWEKERMKTRMRKGGRGRRMKEGEINKDERGIDYYFKSLTRRFLT